MMTQTQALATLAREDPAAAGDARAALTWLAGERGLGAISQLRLQEFLWHALPATWPLSTAAQLGVARALGRVLLLAGLDRYAAICCSPGTERVIAAYADGRAAGVAAYAAAVARSQVAPPDTDLLAWGSVMGPRERTAYEACAAALELAFAAGELIPGTRGWRTKRGDLVNRWLTQTRQGDEAWLARISSERLEAWLTACSGERGRLARAVMPRMLRPPAMPRDPLPTLRWLLEAAADGLRLTARHYIAPAMVAAAAGEFGWRSRSRATELDVPPLHTLRRMAQHEMNALRRRRTSLVLTRTGQLMVADPAVRWHLGTAALIGGDRGFPAALREAALLAVLADGPASFGALAATLTDLHAAEGWCARTPEGLRTAVSAELAGLRSRLQGLGLLTDGSARLALNEAGVNGALSALLGRALRPRHHEITPSD